MCLARTDTLPLRSDKSPARTMGILTQAATSQTETLSNHTHPGEELYPPAYGGYGSYDAPQQPAPIQAGREHYVDDRMYNGANYRGH
jgi:hypothetical protein